MARLVAVALALVLPGCLQAAPDPLAPPSGAALDAALVRDWRCVTAGEDGSMVLKVAEPEPRLYRLRFEMPGEEPMVFEGHGTVLDGTTVLSVRDRSAADAPEGWYFAVPTLHRPDVLELRYVQIEEQKPPARQQVEAALRSGTGLVQACACVPLRTD